MCDDDALPADASPAYRRALGWVVGLNLGFGIVELLAGWWTGSQALKADSLDFLGDGLISLLALAALAWPVARRARVALAQGLFLGAMGVFVLAETGLSVLDPAPPEAASMGAVGVVALIVNLVAAALLLPYRQGDASARAVWLFSRNDAIANTAVVAAALLVGWTGSAWPDLIVALAMAALFLGSAGEIIRDARTDLAKAGAR